MRWLKNIVFAAVLVYGTTALVAGPNYAQAEKSETKVKEKKCNKQGKPCKSGKDCKKENCAQGVKSKK
jgi:hypothetical protein